MPLSFEFTARKLVYGGEALGHYQGRVVLVPRALPGERLEVEEALTAKGVIHARPLRILEAAPERVEPPCPYFGRCGGCQYQHLRPELQSAAKRETLRETLRRIGHIGTATWDAEIPVHAAHPWNYRNQAQLKVALQPDGKVRLGFFEAESHRLVPIDACLILSPRLNAILAELRRPDWSERLAGVAPFSEIELLADDRDEEVRMTLRGSFDGRAPSMTKAGAGWPRSVSACCRESRVLRSSAAGRSGSLASRRCLMRWVISATRSATARSFRRLDSCFRSW